MKPKDFQELLQHYHRRAIARFCLEPRTFDEIIEYMMAKAGWNHDLAYVLVAEHMASLEKAQAVRRNAEKWVTTDVAA